MRVFGWKPSFLGWGVLALCFCVAAPLQAQYTVGRVEGTVMDASNAVIPQAKVTVRNLGTNAVREFTTAADGYYAFVALPPGDYEISAEAPKFTRRKVAIKLHASETVTRNLTLEVGSAPENIVVVDDRENVNLADPQHATTRSEIELASLPSLGRNMINLVTLAPGVQPTNNPRGGSTFGGGGSYVIVLGVQSGLISANGGRARAGSVQLDYTDANDWEGGGFAPGMQAITPDLLQEFKLITSSFSAEYGVKSNVQVMMVTKSGSNNWHGAAYDFVQNDMFNARDYFDTTGRPTPLKQNIYGFNMGGPVRRDRTFFFGGYEGRKVRGGAFTTLANVPTDAARALQEVTFGTNRLPVSPLSIELLDTYVPHATIATADWKVGKVAVQIPSPIDTYQFVLKGDHRLTDKHSVSARYLQSTASFVARFPSQNVLRGFDVDNHFELRNLNLGDTYVLTPRTINEFRLAYARSSAEGNPQGGLMTPRFNISGLVNFGSLASVPAGRIFNVFQANDVVSHIHGSHVLKFGFDGRKVQDNSLNATNSRGVFTFASLDHFLAGKPSSWTQLFGNTYRGFRTGLYSVFAQDDWRIRPTLTLNLGVRWEMQGALSEANGLSSVLDPSLPGAIGGAGTGPLGNFRVGGEAIDSNLLNLAPRVGFAWNPRGGNFVLRGGYGIYWDSFTFGPVNASRSAPPWNYSPTLTCPDPTLETCPINFAALVAGNAPVQVQALARLGDFGTLTNFGTVTTLDPKLKNPYVQNFSLGVEYRFLNSFVGALSYVGTKGTHLTRLVPINPVVGVVPATSTADEAARLSYFGDVFRRENLTTGNNRLDPRFNQVNHHDSGGSSTYHSLQAELRKSFSHGLQFQASYTWSKSIDDASDFAPTIQANDNSFAQDARNLGGERAVSNYDIPHRVVVTAIWKLPFFQDYKGVAGKILDGWSFESVNMWQSALPATLLAGTRTVVGPSGTLSVTDVNLDGNLIPTGTDNTRANCAPDNRFVLGDPSRNFGFSQPLLGNNGTCGRNTVRMSSLTNFDWSFFKNFLLRESGPLGSGPWNLQFRAELYNIFNVPFKTAQGDGWRSVSSSSFGQYNAAGITRRVQLALRLTW
ncbi:MAG: carboxypeptidase regulatory-like domain-containing protein [Terriglobales bacterium]